MDGQQTALQQRLKDIEARLKTFTDPPVIDEVWTIAPIDNSGGGGGATPGGSNTEVQWNNAGAFDGAPNVTIDANDLVVGAYTSTTPANPAAGSKFYSMLRAGRNEFFTLGARGNPQRYAPTWLNNPRIYSATTANTPQVVGAVSVNTINGGGAAAGQTPASTNFLTQQYRLRHTTAAAANHQCGWRSTVSNNFLSSTSSLGGFFWQAKFAIHTAPAASACRYFIGLFGTSSNTIMGAGVSPSNFTDCCGFMQDSGESNLYWGVNDSGGVCTRTSITGADTTTSDAYLYIASIYVPPGSTTVYYALEQYNTSGVMTLVADGSSSTNTPTPGTMLYDYVYGAPTGASLLSLDISAVTMQVEW